MDVDVVDSQTAVLNWASGASRHDRIEFLKQYLKTCEEEELNSIKILTTRRKRLYRKAFFNASAPGKAASAPAKTASVPVDTASAPLKKARTFWWEAWKESERVALDCEFVTLKEKKPGQKKRTVVSATAAVVDWNGNRLLKRTIRHAPKSYLVNWHTEQVNGFKEDSLKDGIPLEEVVLELIELLKGKLVITCGGEGDFQSLGLSSTQFDHFDLQWFWYEKKMNRDGVIVRETFGLRHIYYYYYKKDIQAGVHDPVEDAKATMKIFREQFIPISVSSELYEKGNYKPIENFVRME